LTRTPFSDLEQAATEDVHGWMRRSPTRHRLIPRRDSGRFGVQRTLNLRESLPTAEVATTRAEAWLRQQQLDRAEEVLIITGRGNASEGGVSVVREAVIRLLYVLKRRGVVGGHSEHTPGSFVVTLAPVSALWESPKRNGGRGVAPPPKIPPSLDNLDEETKVMLRNLAERALEGLGVKDIAPFLGAEMLKQFGAIAGSVGDAPEREARLKNAIRAALDQHE
jgi:DNA-nicking Smr family endonuclease